MKTQTIGVEIEFTGITREIAAETVAKYFGTTANYVGGDYKAYEVKDNTDRIWKLMRDGSIKPERISDGRNYEDGIARTVTADDEYKVEFVTPILHYEDIETLQKIVRKLRKAGGFVNTTCGMHVHIGAKKFTPQTIRNLVNMVASKEDLMYKALNVHENRKSFCGKTNQRFLKALNDEKPTTMAQLKALWYDEPENCRWRHPRYHSSRYTICNLHAFFTKKTIEFRIFNATMHAGEVKAAIQFCLALTHLALTTKKAIYRPTITDNPKYTFRCWLLRLGLIGEEFKTCRLHMLKHLEGDSAWRNSTTV